ncbi:DNA polymerase III subunit beta [Patescibacteria group bacterium]|nr:DNA polymerase III subunit beta [Patescibacteria group bacterium]
MKVVCQQKKLAKALGQVAKLVPSRSELPILSNVFLSASKGFLTLQTTDLQLSVSAQVPAEVEEDGEITVPAGAVQSFVSSLSADKINLALEKNQLGVRTDKVAANFVTIPAIDYPSFPEMQNEPIFVFNTEELARLIRKICFSAATDAARPVLTGVYLEVKDKQISFVSTDGFRLSRAKSTPIRLSKEQKPIIIPASAFSEVEKLLSGAGEEEVNVYLTKDANQIIFDLGSVKLASRLLEAEYPDYNKILPESFEFKTVIDRAGFAQAVRTVAVFAQRDAQTIYLTFENNSVAIEAQSSEIGEAREEIAVQIEGEKLKCAFNVGFLIDALESIDGDELVFEAKDSLSPTRWTSPSDKSFFHIIMPIRIEE